MKATRDRNKLLEDRLLKFSRRIIDLTVKLPKTSELRRQLIRAGTSPGANYIEACESVSAKDFVHRIAICRKEARETIYWLTLITHEHPELSTDCLELSREADEFVRIFSSILGKFKN